MRDLQKLRTALGTKIAELEFTRQKLKTLETDLRRKYEINPDQIPEKLRTITNKIDNLKVKLNKRDRILNDKLEKYEII